MKQLFCLALACIIATCSFSQDITGLWKGTMYNDSTKQYLPYEIFISKENGKYIGYSHSWFLIDGEKYYGIKKIKVRIAKDGKILIQDALLVQNNYPNGPDKNISQLNVLDLSNINEDAALNGPFVTNRTKHYSELTGQINLKKANQLTGSALMQYLQNNNSDGGLAVVK